MRACGERRPHVDNSDVAGIESRVDAEDVTQTVQQQRRTRDEHECDRDLDRDERGLEPLRALRRRRPGTGSRCHCLTRSAQCGHRAEHDRGQHGEQYDEAERLQIERHLVQPRDARGRQPEERAQPPHTARAANRSGNHSGEQTLAEQLPRKPRTRRAERTAHRELRSARDAARKEEVGDVCTREHQQQCHRAEQQEQPRACVADSQVAQRMENEVERIVA